MNLQYSSRVILIAEDEPDTRGMLTEYLTDAGFSVVDVGTAQEAVDVFDSHSVTIDLVVSDINMPGEMDGRALANWLLVARPRIPVILTSGAVTLSFGVNNRIRRFIPKPYDLEDMQHHILELLN